MKVVIVTAPMMNPDRLIAKQYPVDGSDKINCKMPVRSPINSVLATKLQKDEDVKVIYITIKDNKKCTQNIKNFTEELETINKEIEAKISYTNVEIEFKPTKQTYNKLITDLAEKVPNEAELFIDITYSYKPAILSLFCALRFVEEFNDAVIQYIVYGKVEFDDDNKPQNPMLYDITSLYYLFKLMGTMGATNAEEALKTLKDFFAM